MFNIFTAANFISELKINLNRASYSVELLIDEGDLLQISKTLLNVIEKDVDVIIIISAANEIKSLRVYNYTNRLIECGARVYWNTDKNIFILKSHFLIHDKVNVINKVFYKNEDNVQNQVLYFNNIFDKIVNDSKEICINKEKIKIDFSADKTIINKNQLIKIRWDVKNADFFTIKPNIVNPMNCNFAEIQLQNDTLFTINASNHNENVSKNLYIKVINKSNFSVEVKVFDPYLSENVFLRPYYDSKVEKYVCYFGQKVFLKFIFSSPLKIKEEEIGELKPNQEFSFKITKDRRFTFNYLDNSVIKVKKILIKSKMDRELLELVNKKI
tara:strand:- start:8183 stop:9166 length:984 start_codon:yes stop_codon:yes gene_type:complete